MSSARHLYPTSRAQILLTEDQHHHQRGNCGDVNPVHALQQHLVVDQAHPKHSAKSAHDPVHLLDVSPRKLRVLSRAVDLHHAQPADEQDEDQQHPIKVVK